jgi:hypothetical protein
MIVRRRFGFQHVDGGPAQMSGSHGFEHCQHIDHRAPGGVYKEAAGLHFGERLAVDKMPRLGRVGAMQRDDIGLSEELVQRLGGTDPERLVSTLRRIRVEIRDLHPERLCAQRGGGANSSDAHDSKDAPAQPVQRLDLGVDPGPLPASKPAVHVVNAAGQGEHHADGGVRDILRAVVGHVRDDDAPLTCDTVRDVVETHAASNDEPAPLKPFDGPRGEADEVVEHDRIGIFNSPGEIVLGIRVQPDHVRDLAEDAAFVIEGLTDKIGDHDFGALAHGLKETPGGFHQWSSSGKRKARRSRGARRSIREGSRRAFIGASLGAMTIVQLTFRHFVVTQKLTQKLHLTSSVADPTLARNQRDRQSYIEIGGFDV